MIIKQGLKSRSEVLSFVQDGMNIVDIGGASKPFNKANYIIDIQPYESYIGKKPGISATGWFDEDVSIKKENWVVQDICSRQPFPFSDNFFDFSVCTQTLEDIRDPIWVVSEISRISKAGYIEVPSIQYERSNIESPFWAGACHHRWLISIENDSLKFLYKYSFVNAKELFLEIPKDFMSATLSIIWENSIDAYEKLDMTWGGEGIIKEITEINDKNTIYKLFLKTTGKSYIKEKLKKLIKKYIGEKNYNHLKNIYKIND